MTQIIPTTKDQFFSALATAIKYARFGKFDVAAEFMRDAEDYKSEIIIAAQGEGDKQAAIVAITAFHNTRDQINELKLA